MPNSPAALHQQYRHDDRPLAAPWGLAQLGQHPVDLRRVKMHGQLMRPVVAALVVLFRDPGHHVEIVEGGDEPVGMRGALENARIVLEPRIARHLDQHLAQTLRHAPRALAHVGAGDDRVGLI